MTTPQQSLPRPASVAATREPAAGTPAWLRGRRALRGSLLVPALVLVAVVVIALTQGAAGIPPQTALGLLANRLPFVSIDLNVPGTWDRIIFDVRLPRIIAAAIVGGALAYAGATYQGVFRNPLADPFLLGVAAGAALGASVAIVSPLPVDSYGFGWVPVFAFAGAMVTVVLVYLVSRSASTVNNTTLILAGVALSAVASAATSFMLLTGGERAQPIFSFLFGGFNTAAWPRLLAALPYLVAGALVIALHTRVLNVLQLDEEQAAHLGVDVARTKLILLAAASLIAATAVAIAGIIGFVGLVVPHVVRMLYGGDYRRVLPAAILVGAAFLVAVDVFARTVIAPQEVPVGIVTAMLGGPFFLYLLRVRRASGL